MNLDITRDQLNLVERIVERVWYSDYVNGLGPMTQEGLKLVIVATHCNSVELDFDKFLNFDTFNFWHDVFGIIDHFNEETATLSPRFLPRCATNISSRREELLDSRRKIITAIRSRCTQVDLEVWIDELEELGGKIVVFGKNGKRAY